MHWIITNDLLADDPHSVGQGLLPPGAVGVNRSMRTVEERTLVVDLCLRLHADKFTHEFRLSDDDGDPYYQGRCGDCTDTDGDSAFAPLDWAANYAGCTTMEYRKAGETDWKVL